MKAPKILLVLLGLSLVLASCSIPTEIPVEREPIDGVESLGGRTPLMVDIEASPGVTITVHFDFNAFARIADYSVGDISCRTSHGDVLVYRTEPQSLESPFGVLSPIGDITLSDQSTTITCIDTVGLSTPLRLTASDSVGVIWKLAE